MPDAVIGGAADVRGANNLHCGMRFLFQLLRQLDEVTDPRVTEIEKALQVPLGARQIFKRRIVLKKSFQ